MQIVIMPCGGGGFVHRGGLNGIDDSSSNTDECNSDEISGNNFHFEGGKTAE